MTIIGDGTRDAIEQELADERAHLATVEAIDPAGLSAAARFERDLEIHNVRRSIFETDEVRTWARRSHGDSTTSATACSCCSRATTPRCPSV